MSAKKKTHGGRRPGAGRKADPLARVLSKAVRDELSDRAAVLLTGELEAVTREVTGGPEAFAAAAARVVEELVERSAVPLLSPRRRPPQEPG